MELINILDDLLKKYKNNGKLSQTDELLAKQKLIELIKEDASKSYTYVLDYQVAVGVQAYVEVYKSLDRAAQINLNKGLLSSDEFTKNTSNKIVNKTSSLIGKLMKINGDLVDISFILKRLCQIILDNKKHSVSEKNAGYVTKELLETYLDNLIKIDIRKVPDLDFNNITTVFFETVFNFNEKINGLSRKQFAILKWIASTNRKVNLSDGLKSQIAQNYNKWPIELKRVFTEMGLNGYYKDFIQFECIYKNNNALEAVKENPQTFKGNGDTEDMSKLQVMTISNETNSKLKLESDRQTAEKNGKEVSAKEKLLDVISYIENVESQLNDLKNIRLENSKLKTDLADKDKEILDLKNKIEEDKNKIQVMTNTIDSVEYKITSAEEQIEAYKRNEDEYKKQIEALYSVNKNEDNSAMEAFKNKIAGKLRDIYLDVKGTEELGMNIELGESLRFQFMDLFEELKRLGINL